MLSKLAAVDRSEGRPWSQNQKTGLDVFRLLQVAEDTLLNNLFKPSFS